MSLQNTLSRTRPRHHGLRRPRNGRRKLALGQLSVNALGDDLGHCEDVCFPLLAQARVLLTTWRLTSTFPAGMSALLPTMDFKRKSLRMWPAIVVRPPRRPTPWAAAFSAKFCRSWLSCTRHMASPMPKNWHRRIRCCLADAVAPLPSSLSKSNNDGPAPSPAAEFLHSLMSSGTGCKDTFFWRWPCDIVPNSAAHLARAWHSCALVHLAPRSRLAMRDLKFIYFQHRFLVPFRRRHNLWPILLRALPVVSALTFKPKRLRA